MNDEPFGRQPQPVRVTLIGAEIDVNYWGRELRRRAEFKGDQTQIIHDGHGVHTFKIYPRAVND